MKPTNTIRLLTATTNEQGDLFTRLMDHLFFALGYGDLRHDIAKSGREIDVHGTHRTEPRQMRAECKAHKKKMGGDEVGKFRGAALAEQILAGKQKITGYFISLGGFTESAIEQEKSLGSKGLILIDAPRIIKELELSHVLVSDAEATDQAGRCVQRTGQRGLEVEGIELLGHEVGYVKAVYYGHNKQRTHVALIYADGAPLATGPAQEIIEADKTAGGTLYQLHYLAPEPMAPDNRAIETQALALYRAWIAKECGVVLLDGLPIDEKLSPKPLRLEKLFVPLRAIIGPKDHPIQYQRGNLTYYDDEPEYNIGYLLAEHKHLALLAAPGGGKSTLLKRLAMAYAFPDQETDIEDGLPERDWLPLFLRCRELRDRTSHPILQLLEEMPKQLGLPDAETEGFRRVLHEALQSGKILLLVDGLDEIWEEGPRKNLANNLRAFTSIYPAVQLVVTSREAGFRIVAGVIADVCQLAHLAPLDEEDIHHLCTQWHVEVVNDSPQVRQEAETLADTICSNSNIYDLATNPLLLTTLLIVKRSIGELPTYRAALYAEAVKLLVKTWNIEGYNALNEKETFAQLCYVACVMMEQDKKQISQAALLELLQEAREVLAAELQRTTISPEEFLTQVEHRSSLLMLTGRMMLGGELQPIYEFRHLTFQEFLAARGYFKDQHPRRREGLSLADLLSPRFAEANWREVISLAAVQAEYRAEPLIQRLIATCEQIDFDEDFELHGDDYDTVALLLQCIEDEVTVSPATLRAALKQLARFASDPSILESLEPMRASALGPLLQEVAEEAFASGTDQWTAYGEALREFACMSLTGDGVGRADFSVSDYLQFIKTIEVALAQDSRIERIKAALNFSSVTFSWQLPDMRNQAHPKGKLSKTRATYLLNAFKQMIRTGDAPSIYAACWAIKYGYQDMQLLTSATSTPDIVLLLLEAWQASADPVVYDLLADALLHIPLFSRDALVKTGIESATYNNFLLRLLSIEEEGAASAAEGQAIATINWYLGGPMTDKELANYIGDKYKSEENAGDSFFHRQYQRSLDYSATLLEGLGKAGAQVLAARERRIERKRKQLAKAKQIEPPF